MSKRNKRVEPIFDLRVNDDRIFWDRITGWLTDGHVMINTRRIPLNMVSLPTPLRTDGVFQRESWTYNGETKCFEDLSVPDFAASVLATCQKMTYAEPLDVCSTRGHRIVGVFDTDGRPAGVVGFDVPYRDILDDTTKTFRWSPEAEYLVVMSGPEHDPESEIEAIIAPCRLLDKKEEPETVSRKFGACFRAFTGSFAAETAETTETATETAETISSRPSRSRFYVSPW